MAVESQHLREIYAEGELDETPTCKAFLQVRAEGVRQVSRNLQRYSLEAILAVGFYRPSRPFSPKSNLPPRLLRWLHQLADGVEDGAECRSTARVHPKRAVARR
jgi:hypothetical protein